MWSLFKTDITPCWPQSRSRIQSAVIIVVVIYKQIYTLSVHIQIFLTFYISFYKQKYLSRHLITVEWRSKSQQGRGRRQWGPVCSYSSQLNVTRSVKTKRFTFDLTSREKLGSPVSVSVCFDFMSGEWRVIMRRSKWINCLFYPSCHQSR